MTQDLLDLAAILAAAPTGVDPREDPSAVSPFRRVRTARDEARDAERAFDARERSPDEPPDEDVPLAEGWRTVRRVAEEMLAAGAKDFELGAWLTEALVRQNGLAGLTTGARLLTALLRTSWEDGFPVPDTDGIEDRASALSGLSGAEVDGTLMQSLRRLALFRRINKSPLPFFRYEQAEKIAEIPSADVRERRYAAGVPTLEIIEAEIEADAAKVRPALRAVAEEAALAREAWLQFGQALAQRFPGRGDVSASRVARLLEHIEGVTRKLSGQTPASANEPGVGSVPSAEANSNGTGSGGAQQGGESAAGGTGRDTPHAGAHLMAAPLIDVHAAVASREGALEALERIADFFGRTEPHSPLAYTLREAVRRGRMTLPELLTEVLADDAVREAMLSALGIRPQLQEHRAADMK